MVCSDHIPMANLSLLLVDDEKPLLALLKKYNVNDYAASVQVYAVKA